MKYQAVLEITEDSERLYKALLPEISEMKTARASVEFKLENDKLVISINAKDFSSFRAMETGVMRLLIVFNKMKNESDN
jgi:tRNA threonylcarbamoyladenosine modification (KEOPS) complex  Pcc1 subunit